MCKEPSIQILFEYGLPMTAIDSIELSQALIRCDSVTPADAGALDVLQNALESLGFVCQRHVFTQDGTPDI